MPIWLQFIAIQTIAAARLSKDIITCARGALPGSLENRTTISPNPKYQFGAKIFGVVFRLLDCSAIAYLESL